MTESQALVPVISSEKTTSTSLLDKTLLVTDDFPSLLSDPLAQELNTGETPAQYQTEAPTPAPTVFPQASAQSVAEGMLAWAAEHHMLDPLAVTAHGTNPVELGNGSLISDGGNTVHTLRAKQVAGVLFNETEKTVYVLTRKKISSTAVKTMPAWQAGINVKYLYFGQALSGGPSIPSDGNSYRELNGRYCCGSSIHPARFTGAGTIGCLLRDKNGKLYGLSANHVSGLSNYADEGEKILAPGHSDITPRGRDPFTIGIHVRALPMNHGSPTNVDIGTNTDAAVFEIRDPDSVSSSQGGFFDTPAIAAEPTGGMQVEKVGRTTGYTTGRIIGTFPTPCPVSYQMAAVGGNATVYFNNLVTVFGENGTVFSAPGDSGALVISHDANGTPCAVGLLVAGTSTGYSLILPIQTILAALDMTLVSNHHT